MPLGSICQQSANVASVLESESSRASCERIGKASKNVPVGSPTSVTTDFLPSLRDITLVSGIYVCFLGFGYVQENLFHFRHSITGELFAYPIFLVALLCAGNVLVSGLVLLFESQTDVRAEVEPSPVDDTGVRHELKSPTASDLHFSSRASSDTGEFTSSKDSTVSRVDHEKSGNASPRIAELTKTKGKSFLQRYLFSVGTPVLHNIALSSLTYVLSMLCTNYALTHVSYPTQVLIKSAKSVPVILGGAVFFKKRYPLYDYVVVAVITAALAVFNFTQQKAKISSHGGRQQSWLGLLFLCISLFCDSMTGPWQDQLLTRIKITSTHLMFLTNIFACGIASVICLFIEGFNPLAYCFESPHVWRHIILFCCLAGVGQLFIFGCLMAFGSLRLALITTTRKFFTVVLSVLLFGHSISALQWMCVIVIFTALSVQSYCTKRLKRKAEQRLKSK